jgi:hypothetical protein
MKARTTKLSQDFLKARGWRFDVLMLPSPAARTKTEHGE